ncbi:deaminase, partial [Enterococcus faecium]
MVNTNLDAVDKEKWMRLALAEAKKAEVLHEVPIGAVVVLEGEVIGKG